MNFYMSTSASYCDCPPPQYGDGCCIWGLYECLRCHGILCGCYKAGMSGLLENEFGYHINGVAGVDDLGIARNFQQEIILVFSERAKPLLCTNGFRLKEIQDYNPNALLKRVGST